MSNSFEYTVLFSIRSDASTSSAREAIDMIIAALSMDIPIAVVFEPTAVDILDLQSAHSERFKKLPMLEDIFDLDSAYLVDSQPPAECALEGINTATEQDIKAIQANAKHHIWF